MFILCAVFAVIYLTPLATHPLMEPDEGRYAEIAREMLESGDYVTPTLNYVAYFEKPALLYWAQALSFKVFGTNEFSARLPSALAALGGIAVTGLLGAFVYGRRAGALSAVVVGTSLLYFAIGTLNLTDMPLSLFITLAMSSFYVGTRSGNRRWYALFYASAALGLLAKGLIAIVLPGAVIFCYVLATRKWRIIPRMFYLPGMVLFAVIAVPWFYLVCRENVDFFYFFFIQEHFLRFATKMHDRYEPFWFFVPMIIAGFMPWTGFMFSLGGRKSILREPPSLETRDANIFLVIWFAVIFIFFSASSSKLIPYITPCLPPLAVLLAANIERTSDVRGIKSPFAWNAAINMLFVAALFGFALFGRLDDAIPRGEVVTIAAALSAGLLLTVSQNKNILPLMLGALLFALCLQALYIPLGRTRSIEDVARLVAAHKRQDERIAVYGEVLQALPFYAKERVVLVDYRGELAFGASREPEEAARTWFPSRDEFLESWNEGDAYALVVKKKRLKSLFPDGVAGSWEELDVGSYSIIFNGRGDSDAEK